jgi:FixJ family two-component response regulator
MIMGERTFVLDYVCRFNATTFEGKPTVFAEKLECVEKQNAHKRISAEAELQANSVKRRGTLDPGKREGIVRALTTSDLSIAEIANTFNVSTTTVTAIKSQLDADEV